MKNLYLKAPIDVDKNTVNKSLMQIPIKNIIEIFINLLLGSKNTKHSLIILVSKLMLLLIFTEKGADYFISSADFHMPLVWIKIKMGLGQIERKALKIN